MSCKRSSGVEQWIRRNSEWSAGQLTLCVWRTASSPGHLRHSNLKLAVQEGFFFDIKASKVVNIQKIPPDPPIIQLLIQLLIPPFHCLSIGSTPFSELWARRLDQMKLQMRGIQSFKVLESDEISQRPFAICTQWRHCTLFSTHIGLDSGILEILEHWTLLLSKKTSSESSLNFVFEIGISTFGDVQKICTIKSPDSYCHWLGISVVLFKGTKQHRLSGCYNQICGYQHLDLTWSHFWGLHEFKTTSCKVVDVPATSKNDSFKLWISSKHI